jgi:hypothetical protein
LWGSYTSLTSRFEILRYRQHQNHTHRRSIWRSHQFTAFTSPHNALYFILYSCCCSDFLSCFCDSCSERQTSIELCWLPHLDIFRRQPKGAVVPLEWEFPNQLHQVEQRQPYLGFDCGYKGRSRCLSSVKRCSNPTLPDCHG